jgi:hypothetical protein
MLPGANDGYRILPAPPGYAPIRTPARKLMATPTPFGQTPLYQIPEEDRCGVGWGAAGPGWAGRGAGQQPGVRHPHMHAGGVVEGKPCVQ